MRNGYWKGAPIDRNGYWKGAPIDRNGYWKGNSGECDVAGWESGGVDTKGYGLRVNWERVLEGSTNR